MKHYTRFLIRALVLVVFFFTTTTSASAGSNGQQLSIYACQANKIVIRGVNQNNQNATYTFNKNTSDCGWYNITGWYWKGTVTVTPYYYVTSEYPSYPKAASVAYVPTSQFSNWFSITVQPPTARQKLRFRAQTWVNDHISYNQGAYHDGYRQDCSGYTSFVWGLSSSYSTSTILQQSYKISYDNLQVGDALDNALNSGGNAHMLIFNGWVNQSAGVFNAYEENPYYGGAHLTPNITLNKSTGKLTLPGYTYPGTFIAIRKNGL